MRKGWAAAIALNLIAFATMFLGAELWCRRGDIGSADWLERDPLLGYRLNRNLEGINEFGIRHGPIAMPKTSPRVIVLGDSVAAPSDGFVSRLQCGEVINAAIPGYTTHQERLLFERDLVRFDPDLVIVQYCLNDNHRFLHHLDENRRWLVTDDVRDESWLERHSVFALRVRFAWQAGRRPGSPWERDAPFRAAWTEEGWAIVEESLAAIAAATSSIGASMAIVAVPYEPQLDPEYGSDPRTFYPQRKLAEIAERLRIPLLDLYPLFAKAEGELFTDGIHLTDAGHQLAADALKPLLGACRRER